MALCNILEESRSHILGDAGHDLVHMVQFIGIQFSTFGFGASYANLRSPDMFKWQIKRKKTSSCIRVNVVINCELCRICK